ncbi:MAG: hypothetical protein RL748_2899 [Pseudomonadota bacterium]|jgi:hypothetical protein
MDTLNRCKNLFVFVPVLLAGCALPQAPLVYSSKVAIGVGISAATPDQPGVDIHIGYKQVDVAYVPVAVGKPCDPANSKAVCGLEKLEGKSKVDSSEGGGLANLHFLEKQLKNARGELLKMQKNGSATDIANAKSALEAAELKFNTTLNGADKQVLLAASGDENNKHDAYSVFGSFDSFVKAGGNADKAGPNASASLNLGRIFSTGVAAQHLTEGMGHNFKNGATLSKSGSAECMAQSGKLISSFESAVNKTTTEGQKQLADFVKKALDICG